MMIPHNHDRLTLSSFVHDQEQIFPNPNPNSEPASTNTCKRKRNLPGNPDPNAEVIALSPKSLMATNRFFCELCNKGFQREQNLQLHKRGHNLPWKLKQRMNKDDQVKKKVYICPEKSCVHHDPARALGDLTGIKKHFSRKHGEKKWKCDKCSKKYAVISDWKAHSKICGSRDYRCDCGTLFSRKDSLITHRAFCDVLAEENAKLFSGPSLLAANSTISTVTNTNSPILIQSQLDQSLTSAANLNINNNIHTTFLGQNFTSSDPIPQQANAFTLSSSPPSPRNASDHLWKLQGEECSHQWLLNECMNNNNKNVDEIKKGNIYGGSNLTGANIESLLWYNQEARNLASFSATTLLQKVAQMGSSSSSKTSTMFGLMTSSIFNNTMPNSNCLKAKNREEELTRDFLGVGSHDHDQQRLRHHHHFPSSVPFTVNNDIPKLAETIVGGKAEATGDMASDSEITRFC
ncbi:Protein indeterminate-domain 13 [Cardamine amara subsp. amara]|uniref:Protein indeterminate-domain 13 n=1 Tax=Cardamine amara subsp. amara TaxID=228776 RepID=A0ABD1APC7_CARAN